MGGMMEPHLHGMAVMTNGFHMADDDHQMEVAQLTSAQHGPSAGLSESRGGATACSQHARPGGWKGGARRVQLPWHVAGLLRDFCDFQPGMHKAVAEDLMAAEAWAAKGGFSSSCFELKGP